ncbi:MAG: rhomboid family intramembrane serine protease [Breznakibacter sp.]
MHGLLAMSQSKEESDVDQKRFVYGLVVALFFAFIMIVAKMVETLEHISLVRLGIHPRSIAGLWGILTSPFVHGDWGHLFSNITSFTALMVALLYFYKGVAYRVFFGIYIFSGLFVWAFGRESWHIGSSGLIYGMAAFLFFSGIVRQYIPLMAISLIVAFLYGSMVWGIFPLAIHLPYSWEAHLGGTIAGILLAVLFRASGPQKPKKVWDEDDPEADESDRYWEIDGKVGHDTT